MSNQPSKNSNNLEKYTKEDRIWVDGCYDVCHFGHANSLRQAKLMGKYLIVGVHSNAEIEKHKGPPVFTDEERYEMVRSIKWVDEVVEDAPYVTDLKIMDQYNCQYCAHGDDLTMDANGVDTYQEVKDQGRYKEFKRTQGVSTTNIVGRMILACQERKDSSANESNEDKKLQSDFAEGQSKEKTVSPFTGVSKFLQTTQRITQFQAGAREATADDVVVYVSGAFDVFHNGHLGFLKAALEQTNGTYLVVGLHSDEEVQRYRGNPIFTLNERTLSILACKYVNEVVIGAPYKIDNEIINHFKINYVCHGQESEIVPCVDGSDPYEVAKEKGIYRQVNSKSEVTASVIIDRIVRNKLKFEERNRKKQEKENRAFAAWERSRQEKSSAK